MSDRTSPPPVSLPSERPVLTVGEAAALLGVNVKTLYAEISAGRFPAIRPWSRYPDLSRRRERHLGTGPRAGIGIEGFVPDEGSRPSLLMALNFVAADDGLEEDPKLLTLARVLKVPRSEAFWFVMRWQRLILHKGNHVSGSLPKSYTAADVATFLDFRGDPRRLIEAMKKQGYISFKKGRGFYYPTWKDTTTGRYAFKREDERLRKDRERKRNRSAILGASTDVRGPSSDRHEDSPRTLQGSSTGRKQGSSSDGPPDPPPAGGDSLADARWDWLNQHAPTPQNRDGCKKRLAPMSQEDWDLVTRGYGRLSEPGAFISKKDRRALHWPTDVFLRKQAYLRFRVRERPTRTTATRETNGASSPLADMEQRLADSDAFVVQLLEDPQQSEEIKEAWRQRWRAKPENQGRQPPWDRREQGVS